MNAHPSVRPARIVATAIIAFFCGGFAWTVVGGALLDAGRPLRTILWALFTVFGAWSYWSQGPQAVPDRKTVIGTCIVLVSAITAVVLLSEPANLFVGAVVLLVGLGGVMIARGAKTRQQ
jgi:hypothetical protein